MLLWNNCFNFSFCRNFHFNFGKPDSSLSGFYFLYLGEAATLFSGYPAR